VKRSLAFLGCNDEFSPVIDISPYKASGDAKGSVYDVYTQNSLNDYIDLFAIIQSSFRQSPRTCLLAALRAVKSNELDPLYAQTHMTYLPVANSTA